MDRRPRRRTRDLWNALAGGLFLIGLGVIFYLVYYMGLSWEHVWPLMVVLIGIVVIAAAVAGYFGRPAAGGQPL